MPDLTNTVKFLAISDLHGNLDAMSMLHERIATLGKEFDFVLFAGDFSNFIFEGREAVETFPLILEDFEDFGIPVYFIRGNRDQNLQMRRVLPVAFDNGIPVEDRIVDVEGIEGLKIAGQLAEDVNRLPVDDHTILITHDAPRNLRAIPFLHVTGHTHVARYQEGFLNAGFLYRTPEHGAKPMNGIFWTGEIDVEGGNPVLVSLNWYSLEGKDDDTPQAGRRYPFKELVCEYHPDAGTWIIPFYWKKCQLCYKEGR